MALDLIEELEKLVDALAADSIPYALCGGLAVGVHGLPRATVDIGKPDENTMQRVSKMEPGTSHLVSLDLLFVGPVHQQVWDERIAVPWRTTTLWVVSREGLASMKSFAGRPQDLADIARLEGNDEDEDT